MRNNIIVNAPLTILVGAFLFLLLLVLLGGDRK